MRRVSRARLGVAALVVAGCVAAIPAIAADQAVTANPDNTFTPRNVTVSAGESVRWTNSGGEHNVKFEDGRFEQPSEPATPDSWPATPPQRTFTAPGTYRYYCESHGDVGGVGMAGTVTVEQASTPGVPGGGTPPAPMVPAVPPVRTTITLRASDYTPRRGQRVRLFGSVRPRRDGLIVRIQRRRRGGSYSTVARARLRAADSGRSRYSRRLRIYRDGVYRARLLDGAAAVTSARRRIDVR